MNRDGESGVFILSITYSANFLAFNWEQELVNTQT